MQERILWFSYPIQATDIYRPQCLQNKHRNNGAVAQCKYCTLPQPICFEERNFAMEKKPSALIAMSGGVDSSVAAYIMKKKVATTV